MGIDQYDRYREEKQRVSLTRGDMVSLSGDVNRHARYVIVSVDTVYEPPMATISECGTGYSKTVDVDRLKLVNA